MTRAIVIGFAVLAVSCSGLESKRESHLYNIDSLITAQVELLRVEKHKLNKTATVGSETTNVTVTPDSLGWADELAVFRQLELADRPVHRDKYAIKEFDDPYSNLRIRSYEAKDTPVPVIRLFYLDHPGDVRRIESRYSESNSLYKSERDLVMEFEVDRNIRTLRYYKVVGFQKIMMADSVHFSIEGEVL